MRRPCLSAVEECYRGSGVRVFRLNVGAVVAALHDRARRLIAERPEVLEVRLFGSLTAGTAGPGSDADILVVLQSAADSFVVRVADYARYFTAVGIGCDVFPYTASEIASLRRDGNGFAETAWRQSQVLAARGV